MDDMDEIAESQSKTPSRRKRAPVPKIETQFTVEDIEQLISTVEAHPAVWDIASKNYNMRNKRAARKHSGSASVLQHSHFGSDCF